MDARKSSAQGCLGVVNVYIRGGVGPVLFFCCNDVMHGRYACA